MTSVDKTYQQAIHTIFFVDDDEDDRTLLSDALKNVKGGPKIETFNSCAHLFSMLAHLKPDILFLDLDMPFKNGLECIVDIKSNPKTDDLPIVVFSSTSKLNNIQAAYELGAHLFVIKPALYTELLDSLNRLLLLDWSCPDAIRQTRWIDGRFVPFT